LQIIPHPRGWGVLTAKTLKGKYETKHKFLEGWGGGFKLEKTFVGVLIWCEDLAGENNDKTFQEGILACTGLLLSRFSTLRGKKEN